MVNSVFDIMRVGVANHGEQIFRCKLTPQRDIMLNRCFFFRDNIFFRILFFRCVCQDICEHLFVVHFTPASAEDFVEPGFDFYENTTLLCSASLLQQRCRFFHVAVLIFIVKVIVKCFDNFSKVLLAEGENLISQRKRFVRLLLLFEYHVPESLETVCDCVQRLGI